MDWVFHENERKHYLMMLTSQELRFYDALPKDWEGWSKPVFGTPLLSAHIIDKKCRIFDRIKGCGSISSEYSDPDGDAARSTSNGTPLLRFEKLA